MAGRWVRFRRAVTVCLLWVRVGGRLSFLMLSSMLSNGCRRNVFFRVPYNCRLHEKKLCNFGGGRLYPVRTAWRPPTERPTHFSHGQKGVKPIPNKKSKHLLFSPPSDYDGWLRRRMRLIWSLEQCREITMADLKREISAVLADRPAVGIGSRNIS